MPDAIDLLMSDHREVDEMFDRYLQLPEADHAARRQVVDEVITALSVHAAVEEQFLYPFIRDRVEGGDEMAEHSLEEHQEAKEVLHELEELDPADDRFDAAMRELIEDIRHHVEEEEHELLPQLREATTPDLMAELGTILERAKGIAPTRPHPRAPNEPPANMLTGPMAGLVDRAQEAFRKATD